MSAIDEAALTHALKYLTRVLSPALRALVQPLVDMPRCENHGCETVATRAGRPAKGRPYRLSCDQHGHLLVPDSPFSPALRKLDGLVQLATRLYRESL